MAFVAFEGLDGSGKTTLIKGLIEKLQQKGVQTHLTREPGGTPLGEKIRVLLLEKSEDAPVPRAELLLYQAVRAQHVDKVIRPKIASGQWVFCDRYTASSVAFQCGGRSLGRGEVDWLNNYATDLLDPDLNVLIDVSVEAGRERLEKRLSSSADEKDRFESEREDFHKRVRDFYLKLAQSSPDAWLVLDGNKSSAELVQLVLKEFERRQWLKS